MSVRRRGIQLLAAALVGSAAVSAPVGNAAAAGKGRTPVAPQPPALSVGALRVEGQTPEVTFAVEGVGEYRGSLELHRSAVTHGPAAPGPAGRPVAKAPPLVNGAGVSVVNHVGFEDYLKGIAEMPSRWPAEALRAQAIAARTYALHVLGTGSLGGQICASEACQVYAGLAKERGPGGANWAAAVDATRGQAILIAGKPILAKYSSSNGGTSIDGGRPYLRALPDPDDAHSPLHRWQLTLSYDDLGRSLAAPGPVVDVRRDDGAVVAGWQAPDGTRGGEVRATPVEFRAKVGAAVPPPPGRSRTVPSPMFSLNADDAARVIVVDGRGFGHGIGMGQYGAYGKALRGMNAAGILAAYYPGTKVVATPPDQRPGSVRVVLDDGRPEVRFSASGTFRVYDEKGALLASVGSGQWRAVPAPRGGLRIVPPAGALEVPRVEGVRIEPASPAPGQEVSVAFRSTVPAYVRAVARAPGGGDAEVLPSRAVGTEEVVVKLPPAAGPGAYVLSLGVDAGGGRTASQILAPLVVAPPEPAAPAPAELADGKQGQDSARALRGMGARVVARLSSGSKAREGSAAEGDGGSPGWVVPLGLVALGGVGGIAARRRCRRQPTRS